MSYEEKKQRQCAYCGDTAQKVCWHCCNSNHEAVSDRIRELEKRVKQLEEGA